MLHLSSHHLIHIQRKTASTFYIIPVFPPPFSPSTINLFHHLAGELVFPLRRYVILPTHNIKQCPCTTITLRLCPLPAHNSQRFSSPQIKRAVLPRSFSPRPHFPPGFPKHVSFGVKGSCSFKKMYSVFYFSPFIYSPALPGKPQIDFECIYLTLKKQWKEGTMDGWMDRVRARMCG